MSIRDDSPDALLEALRRALALYTDEQTKRRIQLQAVEEITRKFTWTKVMRKYLDLYSGARKAQICM